MDLVKPFFGSGRVVVTDRFYTSVELAQELRANGLEFLGTTMENRKGLPKEFRDLDLHQHYNGKPKPEPKKGKKGGKRGRKSAKKTTKASKKKAPGKAKNGKAANGLGNQPLRLRLRRGDADVYQVENQPIAVPPTPLDPIDESIETVVKDSAPPPPSPVKRGRKRKAVMNPTYATADPKSAFLFSDHMTVLRYEPKEGKKVTLLSTIHHAPVVRNDRKAKPKIILSYNKNKVRPVFFTFS